MARPRFGLHIEFVQELSRFADRSGECVRRGAMRGAERFAARAKLAYRQDVRRAGFGDRLANTWRVEIYPSGGRQSWHPTVFVWTKAPQIMTGHADGGRITSKSGVFLAIPTENVPRRGGRKCMTPLEVEGQFNQDLIVKPTRKPGVYVALVKAVRARSGKGLRRATKRRVAAGREQELIPMFILVREVTLKPRLRWRALEGELAPEFASYLAEEINRELSA